MAICPPPKAPDLRLKDWWVENPWLIAARGKSLSGYERNRVFLNAGGREFFEISGLTGGADSEGDARCVVPVDVNQDGLQDLIVRQAGGGPFLLFENRMPKTRWLEVSLRGTKSNKLGLGARLVAEAGGRTFTRELYPHNTFNSQAPARAHFGLGNAAKVDKLTVTWPSGLVEEWKDLLADQRLRLTEGGSGATAQRTAP
jgi:hypothetical protein